MQTWCPREGKFLCHLLQAWILCPVLHVQVCRAVLDDLIFNGNLVQLLPKSCLGTRWVSAWSVCVWPVQKTHKNEIGSGFCIPITALGACPAECCGNTTQNQHPWLQPTTFPVHRWSLAAMLLVDTQAWGMPQLPRDWTRSPWQLGCRGKVCSSALGANSQGRCLPWGDPDAERGVYVEKRKACSSGRLCLMKWVGTNGSYAGSWVGLSIIRVLKENINSVSWARIQ